MINAKKKRQTIEWERLKISSRKLEIQDRNGMDLREAEDIKKGSKNTQNNYTKKIFMIQITTMV